MDHISLAALLKSAGGNVCLLNRGFQGECFKFGKGLLGFNFAQGQNIPELKSVGTENPAAIYSARPLARVATPTLILALRNFSACSA